MAMLTVAPDCSMKWLLLMFLLLFALTLLCSSSVSCQNDEGSCYCVKPDHSEPNSTNPCQSDDNSTDLPCPCEGGCHSLMYYTGADTFKNYSTFYFWPGTHVLQAVFNVTTHSIKNLTLVGYDGNHSCGYCHKQVAKVECEGNQSGFLFNNVTNLSIIGLSFYNCGFVTRDKYPIAGALLLKRVWNLYMCDVGIYHARGRGLYCDPVYGKSLITYAVIEHGHNISNHNGGNVALHYHDDLNEPSSINVTHSYILHGGVTDNGYPNTSYAGGIDIYLETTDRIHILLQNVILRDNSGHDGGNLAITYSTRRNAWNSSITIDNCDFTSGKAHVGGGLYISLFADIQTKHAYSDVNLSSQGALVLSVTGTSFVDNTAEAVGAGAYIQLHEHVLLSVSASISFSDCTFRNNTSLSLTSGRGGSAVNLINFHIPGYTPHQSPQYTVLFISCNFSGNSVLASSNDSIGSGVLYVEENACTVLQDCEFLSNQCTGIAAVQSALVLRGSITLVNNTGYNGGGMVLCANSIMYLSPDVNVLLQQNHAHNFGGGIYAEFECTQAIPPCFFQVDNTSNITEAVNLYDNTADKAGSAVYGGSVDYCFTFGIFTHVNRNIIFDELFNITSVNKTDLSNITSNPLRVCFCNASESGLSPNCSEYTKIYGHVYSGATLSVSVVVVGQRHGPVPGVVVASLKPKDGVTVNHTLGDLQTTQIVKSIRNCTTLHYTIYSNITASNTSGGNETIVLSVENTDFRDAAIGGWAHIYIIADIQACPPGFTLKQSECVCSHVLAELDPQQPTCTISNESIHREGNFTWWVGFKKSSSDESKPPKIIYDRYCPFDYCVAKSVAINSTSQDSQCEFQRTGILCGACKNGSSNVFGSSKCSDCKSHYLALRVLGLTILFGLLGILLVIFLGILNLNVTEGTLNAIVFYANVVRVNTSLFFYSPEGISRTALFLKVFVAWMNLDLGIDVCYYNSMGAIGKTALQFAFPLYLWVLAGLIIYFSKKSKLVAKMIGKNAVKLLATIILFSYAKILRTIIDIFRISDIHYNIKLFYHVWTIDGNIPYFQHNHAILFAFAVLMAGFTLPYTLALLFIQCLRKRSDMKLLFWVNKLKPFFDAYTGPYKDRYHFWTGFLLIVRIGLFIGFATNTSKGPILNITLIIATASLLLLLIQPGIYKKWQVSAVEAFTYFNLIIFTTGVVYVSTLHYGKDGSIKICVGSMFLLFCGVVVYHVYKKLSDTQRWRKMKVWLLDKKWPWMRRKPIRSLILPHIDTDSDLSSSDDELDPVLRNAPPVARFDQYREPLIETSENT